MLGLSLCSLTEDEGQEVQRGNVTVEFGVEMHDGVE